MYILQYRITLHSVNSEITVMLLYIVEKLKEIFNIVHLRKKIWNYMDRELLSYGSGYMKSYGWS